MREIERIVRMLRSILARTVEADRRIGGMEFRGRVAAVDGAKHSIKMVIGQTPEGDDVLSPWVPVAQAAGAMRLHDLPSVGQQGVVRSANGDIEQGSFSPLHWSEGFEALSDDPDTKIMSMGAVTVTWGDAGIAAQVGETLIEITSGGILLNGAAVQVVGASHTHNSTNIGDTHVHGGVESGGSNTSTPT